MTPQTKTRIYDGSGYTPSEDGILKLKQSLRYLHPRESSNSLWVTSGPQSVDSHDGHQSDGSNVMRLSFDDLEELEDAFEFFQASNVPLNRLQAEHFPLPTLSSKLRKYSCSLPHDGSYFIVRGLKPQWFSKYKNVVVYTGIASHVGTKRALAPGDPNVLHHVTNLEVPREDECSIYRGPANRTAALPFHTDYGAILSLYMLSRPASGGDFYLADIDDIIRQINASRPDLVETLQRPYVLINPSKSCGYDERPLLFTLSSGRLAIHASRSRIFGTATRPRSPWLSPLSSQQIEAVNALHVAAQSVARRIQLKSGDMLFFNNLRMMHARDAFTDGNEDENTTKRYLLRLILQDEPNGVKWEIPEALESTWRELYDHADDKEVFAIHPELFSFKAAH